MKENDVFTPILEIKNDDNVELKPIPLNKLFIFIIFSPFILVSDHPELPWRGEA